MSEQDAPPDSPEGAGGGDVPPPVESSTRSFSLKLESWMSEALTSDLAPAKSAEAPLPSSLPADAPLELSGAPVPAEVARGKGDAQPLPAPVEADKAVVLEPSPFAPTATGRFLTAPSQKKGGGKAIGVLVALLVLACLGGAIYYFLLRAG